MAFSVACLMLTGGLRQEVGAPIGQATNHAAGGEDEKAGLAGNPVEYGKLATYIKQAGRMCSDEEIP